MSEESEYEEFSDSGSEEEVENVEDGGGGGFPKTEEDAVEFGFEDNRKLTGRRRKAAAKKKAKPGTFGAMGLSSHVLNNIHKRCKFNMPTPIQRKTIPLILQGLDVVGMARTGSGKTAAFIIPMLERLREHSTKIGARAVIMAPSRELALQTYSVIQKLSNGMDLRVAVIVGGDLLTDQFHQLAANPDILVATPGRLGHLLVEVKDFSLKCVEYIVFDEADRLFEMGFSEQIKLITGSMKENRQTLLFSATMPRMLAEFTKSGLQDPEVVRLDTETKISPDLKLLFFTVRLEDKPAAVLYLLREVLPQDQPTIVFVSTKHHVELLAQLLNKEGVEAAYVYGALDQAARKIQVAKFRAKRVNTLIVTDVAARGIDLPLLDNVVHYDFPATPKLFVHRSGRAARAGRQGTSFSLLTRDEIPYLLDLHLFLSRPIKPAPEVISADTLSINDHEVYGSFFPEDIGPLCETVRDHIASTEELRRQAKTAKNGFSLYLKTRQPAANASVKRAKDMSTEGVHPFFLKRKSERKNEDLKAEMELAAFAHKLKMFRPAATVFDAKVSGNRIMADKKRKQEVEKEQGKGDGLKNEAETKPASKRIKTGSQSLQATSEASQESGSDSELEGGKAINGPVTVELDQGKYRDNEFYIGMARGDEAGEAGLAVHSDARTKLESAVMDLMGEDQDGMVEKRRQHHWDKRGRKFVQLPGNEKVKGGRRVQTESGVKVLQKRGEDGRLYAKWSKEQNMRISAPGSQEDRRVSKAMQRGALHGSKFKFKHSKKEGVVNADAVDELKNVDQVRKQRKVKAKLKERNMPRNLRQKQNTSKGKVAKKFATKAPMFKKPAVSNKGRRKR